jgi:hypothetical protein
MLSTALKTLALLICLAGWAACDAREPLFQDNFDSGLSDKWEIVGLKKEDYRIRDGALEVRVQKHERGQPTPMLKVNLPFTTADTVIASVDVTVIGEPLERGEMAGLCLTDAKGQSFTVRKTNIDGFFVFAPGEVDFIGNDGEEGDVSKYTVKYWPADKDAGPLRITIRGHYAHFQTGPSKEGKYRTYFHSAIQETKDGLGFGLLATGRTDDSVRWVRFDNFRVEKP